MLNYSGGGNALHYILLIKMPPLQRLNISGHNVTCGSSSLLCLRQPAASTCLCVLSAFHLDFIIIIIRFFLYIHNNNKF